jgi:3-isopropylmalate dehydrogenase
MILSLAMALRHTLGRPAEADLLEAAIGRALAAGSRTADIAAAGDTVVGTAGMGDAVLNALESLVAETVV